MTVGRRKVLSAGVGALAGSAIASLGRVASAAPANSAPMSATITYGDRSFTYTETGGQDLGDFVSAIGGFTQRCIRARAEGSPIIVFFRPDRNSDRAEVVFELGQLFSGTPANLGSYNVIISRGGQVLAQLEAPAHYWFSRWRWQSAPRPIVGNVAALMQQNLLPPYDRSGNTDTPPPTADNGSTYVGVTSDMRSKAVLTVGGSVSGNIPSFFVTDFLRMTLTAGTTYRVTADSASGAILLVCDSRNAIVANNYASLMLPGQPLTFTPGVTGTYWLTVRVLSTAGSYLVRLVDMAAGTGAAVAAKAAPLPSATSEALAAHPYTIMGLAGLAAYMPTSGEREEIGLMTEPQAKYICLNDAAALATARAQAEASGTMPWHMRDENTGAPINFETYPKACWYQSQRQGTPFVEVTNTPVTLDDAHQPALSYLPYLLTGDPYHLEGIQFQATWNYGSFSLGYRPTISQPRQFAWSMRTLAQCARITPSTVPAWLLGQAYWMRLLETHRLFLETNYVDNAHVEQRVFRTTGWAAGSGAETPGVPAGTNISPWMDDFVANVFGWIVAMGFEDWRKAFTWQIGSTYARTHKSSGWVRAHATPYRAVLRATSTSQFASTWAEAWTLTMTLWPLSYTDPETWVDSDMTYLTYTHGALVYAQQLETFDATESLSWARRQLSQRQWKIPYRWRMGTWS